MFRAFQNVYNLKPIEYNEIDTLCLNYIYIKVLNLNNTINLGEKSMLSKNDFITMSLDINLFFLRIMKEHSFFLEIAFTPVNSQMASEAQNYRIGFEKLLAEATDLADGNVSRKALESMQFVTRFTAEAEKLSFFYTGVPFNKSLTERELMLAPRGRMSIDEHTVEFLNTRAYRLTSALAGFKDRLLRSVLACRVFTLNYPLLIEHILREARLFMEMLEALNGRKDNFNPFDLLYQEVFWNRQMAEHAKFIAGLLDPTEDALIDTARKFGKEFDMLTAQAKQALSTTLEMNNITKDTVAAMLRLRDFKTAGTQGLLDCNIRSIIIPLLADHVLREANHYLCVLGVCSPDNR